MNLMPKKDPRVDAYIAKSADFAKPILNHLRKLVHKACPDVEETLKWSMPAFMHEGILCGMAAFKEHCTFGAWKHSFIKAKASGNGKSEEATGYLCRMTLLADLPSDTVLVASLSVRVCVKELRVERTR